MVEDNRNKETGSFQLRDNRQPSEEETGKNLFGPPSG